MRKLGAALLALPVLLRIYASAGWHSARAGRIVATAAAALVLAVVVFASQAPEPGAAVPNTTPAPVSAQLLNAVRVSQPLGKAFEVRFGHEMDGASVAGALRITPDAAVRLQWDRAGTVLTVTPMTHWAPDTLYTVVVDASARATDGAALARPVRAVFLTAAAGTATIEAEHPSGARVRPDTTFLITLDRPVASDVVRAALRTDPPIDGTLTPGPSDTEFVFTPAEALDAGTSYHLWLESLVDRDGVPFALLASEQVKTAVTPKVVRFRPRDKTSKVQRGATLSVRFTQRMNHASTAAAFHVTANGKNVKGKVSWAEKSEVLVFQPASDLTYGARVRMTVDDSATSRAGVTLANAASGTFSVEPKPKPKPKPKPRTSTPITRSGGGGAVSGSWQAVERYYLKLMNCTRTGGWVTSTGSCSSPGGRNVAPLALSSGISSKVSRPYAKLLATRGLCDHFIGGNPGDRLRRAGYTSYRWAENIGCRSGNPYSAVLGSHRYFQSEKSYGGGHYVNLMNAAYDRVGIGVWVSGGRVRLVVDFYHP